jgi:hypothetical protein
VPQQRSAKGYVTMTTTTAPTFVEYLGTELGLTFKITVTQNTDGAFSAQIDVLEGSADFNALYFGDEFIDGSSFTLGKSLGMNGAGQVDDFGNVVDWDGAQKLSDSGLGKLGADKATYLTAGESLLVTLNGVDSWDDVAELGVRATSTSTESGSIKTVLEEIDPFIDSPTLIEDSPYYDIIT